ncbi:MAG: guanylate kinase [Chthoniobacter sp.]|nr:guanylate kinase [Chthoniobacter sp.]
MNSAPAIAPSFAASQFHRRGILFVVSAPSGAGKSTLLNALRPTADFLYSVSCTTRAPRAGEVDGEDYHFLAREAFERRIAAGDFIEHAQVHGHFYGTPRDNVLRHLDAGTDVLIDIDIQGAASIRRHGGPGIIESLADVFIMPPSLDELRRRLLKRGTETVEQMEVRLQRAAIEMLEWRDYRYTIITGSVEDDVRNFSAIMRAERALSRRMMLG